MSKVIILTMHAQISSGDRSLNFDLTLHLHPYFVYVSSKGSKRLFVCAVASKPSLLVYAITSKIVRLERLEHQGGYSDIFIHT